MRKILIIEDDPIVQDLVGATLGGDQRYELLQAYDGQTGLTLALNEKPILILLDIELPLLNGLEICRRLKSDPRYSNIYIVILSAMSQQEDIEAGKAAGAEDYFVKPFSPLALLRKIDYVLDN